MDGVRVVAVVTNVNFDRIANINGNGQYNGLFDQVALTRYIDSNLINGCTADGQCQVGSGGCIVIQQTVAKRELQLRARLKLE